jgi:hypothetical protein
VSRKRAKTNLYRCIAISLAAHIILLLLPAGIFQTVFPRRTSGLVGTSRDLTPDFAEVAISVLRPPAGSVVEVAEEVPEETSQVEDVTEISPVIPPAAGSPQGSGERTGPGYGNGQAEGSKGSARAAADDAVFFPARPRLIVPPTLEDLQIESLRVDLRILVGADGVPREVIIPDSLSGSEIGLRLAESATRFRFEPAKRGDLPISSWVDLPLLLESSPGR